MSVPIMILYAYGSNGAGQLGVGDLNDYSRPKVCSFVSSLRPGPDAPLSNSLGVPLALVAGGTRTYILFDDGTIFTAGGLTAGDEKRKDEIEAESFLFAPLSFPGNATIMACSSTWDAAFFVDSNGLIYAKGTGHKGELGLGANLTSSRDIRIIKPFLNAHECIVDIASSVSHTVVVTTHGRVFGWGNGRKGQIGEPADVVWSPRQIENIGFKVIRAVCGREFTCLVGDGKGGQILVLGSDKWHTTSSAPPELYNWVQIGASWGSMYSLDSKGSLTSWGRNDRGQLGPIGLPALQRIAVGSEHVIALTHDNRLLCWGWGEHGNCGENIDRDGNVAGVFNQVPFEGLESSLPSVGLGAGCATSFIWSNESNEE